MHGWQKNKLNTLYEKRSSYKQWNWFTFYVLYYLQLTKTSNSDNLLAVNVKNNKNQTTPKSAKYCEKLKSGIKRGHISKNKLILTCLADLEE